jgi:hypothetical protein
MVRLCNLCAKEIPNAKRSDHRYHQECRRKAWKVRHHQKWLRIQRESRNRIYRERACR